MYIDYLCFYLLIIWIHTCNFPETTKFDEFFFQKKRPCQLINYYFYQKKKMTKYSVNLVQTSKNMVTDWKIVYLFYYYYLFITVKLIGK